MIGWGQCKEVCASFNQMECTIEITRGSVRSLALSAARASAMPRFHLAPGSVNDSVGEHV